MLPSCKPEFLKAHFSPDMWRGSVLAIFLTALQTKWEPAWEQREAAPVYGTEAQLALQATEVEMTHTWRGEGASMPHPVLHTPSYSLTITQSPASPKKVSYMCKSRGSDYGLFSIRSILWASSMCQLMDWAPQLSNHSVTFINQSSRETGDICPKWSVLL